MLDILRNRVYIGEIYFRRTWHQAPHQPLVDPKAFEQVQRLLSERGEDHAGQVANRSDYDLAGLICCHHCGKRYLGNAAHGRNGRFRYSTCYTRQRYGTKLCPSDRLPADRLEAAVAEALLETYQRTDLFEQAVAQAHASAATNLEEFTSELATVQANRRHTEQVIGQYLRAFERGAMPEEVCGPRLVELQAEQIQLRDRERELRELLATNSVRAAPRQLSSVFHGRCRTVALSEKPPGSLGRAGRPVETLPIPLPL